MFVVDPSTVALIGDPELRTLVALRLTQVCAGEEYVADRHGIFAVVEPGDTAETIEQVTGVDVLCNSFGDARYGDPEFTPAAEVIEQHEGCFEVVFVFSDEGAGMELFIPDDDRIDRDLLSMCRQFAIQEVEASK